MRKFEIRPSLLKILKKLKSKDKKSYENVLSKISEISNSTLEGLNHYKNLRKPLHFLKRVHVNNSFVLLFSYDIREDKLIFENYLHHDEAYLVNS